jgi:hypothetical protein
LASTAVRVAAVPVLLLKYDGLVYLGPATLSGFVAERTWACRLGRSVLTVFVGSDSRAPYLNGYFVLPEHGGAPATAEVARSTAATRRRVAAAERSSTAVATHPLSGHLHRTPFLDVGVLGIPAPSATDEDEADRRPHDRVVVVHAPSMAPWKGSAQVRAAVAALTEEGLPLEYLELQGVPHDTVVETLARADLVVDELYSDAGLAGLATEAAALGVPPLVFGYAREALLANGHGPLRHYHEPERLLEVLRRFVTDEALREDVGTELQRHVREDRAPAAVAARYLRALTGDPDPAWWRDPAATSYVGGWGIDRVARVAFLRRYVDERGEGALGLAPGSAALAEIRRETSSPA